MATEIGSITTLIGSATATSVDGAVRNLQVGDKVYQNDIITTSAASAIEIEFEDGSIMDLGRNSQAVLDIEVFDPNAPAVETAELTPVVDEDIEAIQQALLEGEDPSQVADPTAAGALGEGGGSEGSSSTVVRDYLNQGLLPDNGFDTTGPNFGLIQSPEDVLQLDIGLDDPDTLLPPGDGGDPDVTPPPNTPPVADPILTSFQFASSATSSLPENAFIFQKFAVGGGVDDSEFGSELPSLFESQPAFGGSDSETSESDLIYTLSVTPDLGQLFKQEADGSFTQLNAGDTFGLGDTIFWTASQSELSTYNFSSQGSWDGVDLNAFNLDGSAGSVTFTSEGIGVAGGTVVPDQLEFRNGQSQKIEMGFSGPSTAAEISVSRLIASEREVGKVEAYLNGVLVGAWTFSATAGELFLQSGEAVDFTLENGLLTVDPSGLNGNATFQLPDGVVFDQLDFTAVEYNSGSINAFDSSDYFITDVSVTKLASTELEYTVTDEDGLVSDPVTVIVGNEGIITPPEAQAPAAEVFNEITGIHRTEFLVGTDGNDIFTGGGGGDTFVWQDGHQGTTDDPALDIVTDFSVLQGDVLDISDLLQGEESGDITDFISVAESGEDVVIQLTPEGNGEMTQTIKLEGTSFNDLGVGGFDAATQQAQIIQTLINTGHISVDQS